MMDWARLVPSMPGTMHILVQRPTAVPGVGSRPQDYLARWPCQYTPISQEEAVQAGYPTARNVLTGPLWGDRILRAGDLIISCIAPDGADYIVADKPWSVVGVNLRRGAGDYSQMTVYTKENT